MTPTVEKILAEVQTLSPLEKVELKKALANEPVQFPVRSSALIHELFGKYRDALSPTEEFMARKQEEIDQEEQRFQRS
jgi:hypothetical protein